jgi:hypothetical protein
VTESAAPKQYLPLVWTTRDELAKHDELRECFIALVENGERVIGVRLPPGMPRPPEGHAFDQDGPRLCVDWTDWRASNTAGLHPPTSDGSSRYIALHHLRWGDRWVEAGDHVPDHEPGRDYGLMLRNGEIGLSPTGIEAARGLEDHGARSEALK